MSRGWWRRNAIALVVLAALVPAGWFAFDTIEFGVVRNPTQSVEASKTAHVEGAVFGVVRMTPLEVDDVAAPTGSKPVLVTIPVHRRSGEPYCMGVTVTETATGRTWRSASGVLTWTPGDGQQETCTSGSEPRFDLVAPVLLAGDAVGPFVVGLSVAREADTLDLEFAVDR
ncbi:MAG TPA: hypothetical protein VEP72_04395 [Microbacterium sp.]|nr:hypothetical protein [Microbacterium sp.]